MRIKSLHLKGFRVFSEPQHIEFPVNGLVAISGPSGSGKSSVFQAIGIALGYSSFAASKQQSWLTDEDMQVDLGLTDGTDEILIRRGKVNQVTVNKEVTAKGATEVNKWVPAYFGVEPAMLKAMTFQPQRSQGAFLQMKNDARRLFLTSVLGLQKYEKGLAGIKADLSDKTKELDNAKLIAETLETNLPPLRTPGYQELKLVGIPGIDPEANQIGTDLEAVFKPLIEQHASNHALLTERQEMTRAEITKIFAERDRVLKVIKAEISGLETRLRNEQYDIEVDHKKREAALPAASLEDSGGLIEARLEKVRLKLAEVDAQKEAADAVVRNLCSKATQIDFLIQRLGLDLAKQQNLVENVKRQECPTCHQKWHEADLNAQLQILNRIESDIEAQKRQQAFALEEVTAKEKERLALVEAKVKFKAVGEQLKVELSADLTRRVAEMNARGEAIRTQVSEIRTSYATAYKATNEAFGQRIKDARTDFDSTRDRFDVSCTELRQQVDETESKKHEIKLAAVALREQLAGAIGLQKSMVAEQLAAAESNKARAATEKKITSARQRFEELGLQVSELQDLEAATKAFLSVINDEILAEIAEEANDFLASLANAKTIRVAFRTERLTDAGDLKSEIKAIVSCGDQENIDPESQLSGGQATSLELAVDRAVANVLRRRHGGSRLPEWVCLDEAFNGHDLETKESCTEVLQRMAADSQIFVIDHGSEFKAGFSRVITVTPGVNGSTVA